MDELIHLISKLNLYLIWFNDKRVMLLTSGEWVSWKNGVLIACILVLWRLATLSKIQGGLLSAHQPPKGLTFTCQLSKQTKSWINFSLQPKVFKTISLLFLNHGTHHTSHKLTSLSPIAVLPNVRFWQPAHLNLPETVSYPRRSSKGYVISPRTSRPPPPPPPLQTYLGVCAVHRR